MLSIILCIIINVLSVILTWKYIKNNLRTDSIILYFDLCVLFFVLIPLTVDNIAILFISPDEWGRFLNFSSLSQISDFSNLSAKAITHTTYFVFAFNIIFRMFFLFITRSFIKKPRQKLETFPCYFYLFLGWLGVAFFALNYGINFAEAGFGYRARVADSSLAIFNILSHIALSASLMGVYLKLQSKQFISVFFYCLPTILIAYLTESRALFIAAIFIFAKYFFSINLHHIKRLVITGIPVAILVLSALSAIRNGSFVLLIYPLWRDSAISDLYFSIMNSELLFNHYQGISRMLLTGIPFVANNTSTDICTLLANVRFFEGWGSLHPAIYGWCFIDAGWFGIFYAAIFGTILAATEVFYNRSFDKIASCFIGLQFAFVPVLVRGSIQYAYATLLYPFILLIFLNFIFWFFHSTKKDTCK